MRETDEGTFRIFDVLSQIDRYRLVVAAAADDTPADAFVAAKQIELLSRDLTSRLKKRIRVLKQTGKT